MPKDPYVGKILIVDFPGSSMLRWRWIVKKREDGRYIVRAPKIGVRLRDLDLKRESDFGKETLLPKNAKPRPQGRRSTRKVKRRV